MPQALICRSIVLLVSGYSAGVYGAGSHFVSLRALYPDPRAVFLGDSGQGITTPEFERVRNKNWHDQLPAFAFGPDATTTPVTQVAAMHAGRSRRTALRSCGRGQDANQPAPDADRQGVSTNTYWKRQCVLDWAHL